MMSGFGLWHALYCGLYTPGSYSKVILSLRNVDLYIALCCTLTMMTPLNGNIFRVTGPLCGEFTGHRWIPLTKARDAKLWCFLWCAPDWVNNREAGDLGRHCAHDYVNVMIFHILPLHTVTWHERLVVSNHKQIACLFNSSFGLKSMKSSKPTLRAVCAGSSRATGGFPPPPPPPKKKGQ